MLYVSARRHFAESTKKGETIADLSFRREDRIRTCDPLVPNQVRYRPALLPGHFEPKRVQM